MNRQRLQSWLLRVAGSVEILAFVAVVMPRSWMEESHAWLGLGEMPGGAVLMFMIRQASYVYGMHGVSLLVLASDVNRFRPLVVLNGISFLLAAPVFFVIDHTAGMPLYWTPPDAAASARRFSGSTMVRPVESKDEDSSTAPAPGLFSPSDVRIQDRNSKASTHSITIARVRARILFHYFVNLRG